MSNPIRLDSCNSTLVLSFTADGIPRVSYWGTSLASDVDLLGLDVCCNAPVFQAGLDNPYNLNIFPENGTGFRGRPALLGHKNSSGFAAAFKLQKVNVDKSRAELEFIDKDICLTLEVCLEENVLKNRSRITNLGKEPYSLEYCAAGVIAVPSNCQELLTFHGCWTGEFQTQRHELKNGMIAFENRTGRTSHEVFPAMIVGTKGFSENLGKVYGTHLGWSGNTTLFCEATPAGERQIQMGELLLPGEVILKEGESYDSPWVYSAFSDSGLNGLSMTFHRFLRNTILPEKTAKRRPVQFNSWEAVYFDHDINKLKMLANKAAKIGIERFVLDDGWFHGRDDDTKALGDWFVDRKKYPDGLTPLIDHVKALGMDFGLWVEPEMVNPESDLYKKHPDWALSLEGFVRNTGRNQLVLDLCNEKVYQYLLSTLSNILSGNDIDYLKWDMNRVLTMAGHDDKPAVREQTLSLYRLVDELRSKFPNVEIESCSSGGGRVDYEILKRTERFWASDSNDPLRRQSIQKGASIFFSPEIIGSHIGPAQSHTSGRTTSIDFRALAAFFFHFGCEFDLLQLEETELDKLEQWIALHKKYRQLLHSGNFIRLDVDESLRNGYGVVSADKRSALFAVLQIATPGQWDDRTIIFSHLDLDAEYCLKIIGPIHDSIRQVNPNIEQWKKGFFVQGKVLMGSGVSICMPWPETGILIELNVKT